LSTKSRSGHPEGLKPADVPVVQSTKFELIMHEWYCVHAGPLGKKANDYNDNDDTDHEVKVVVLNPGPAGAAARGTADVRESRSRCARLSKPAAPTAW
jgi:hypothetical protein